MQSGLLILIYCLQKQGKHYDKFKDSESEVQPIKKNIVYVRMGNYLPWKKQGLKEDENCFHIRYDVEVEDTLHEYNQHTDGNNIQDNQIRVKISTRNGWKELTGYVLTPEDMKSEKKGSPKNRNNYKYIPVPYITLFEGLSHFQRRNYPEPMQIEESPQLILDATWAAELQKFKTIKLLPVGNCGPLCDEIKKMLPACKFVNEGEEGQVTIIVIVKTTRIQSDAEMAIEHANIGSVDRHKTILMMFHSIAGSKTIEDMNNVMYNNPSVYKTFHVPFKRNW